jgi:hypothetical protein
VVLRLNLGLSRLVVRVVQSVVHEGVLRRLLEGSLEGLLGVFYRVRVGRGVAVDGEACQ